MTASASLRRAFREVLHDPTLLLIEIAWRWTFGAIATVVCLFAASLALGSINIDSRRLESAWNSNPFDLAQAVAAKIVAVGIVLFWATMLAVVAAAFCWTIFSAFGRYATLKRRALDRSTTLQTCFGLSALRALLTLVCLGVWLVATVIAALLAAATAADHRPNLAVSALILIPALILIIVFWSAANWYLSLAPLFPDRSLWRSLHKTWLRLQELKDSVLELSIVIATLRATLLVVGLVLCLTVSVVVSNPRLLLADFTAISLLYFLAADFLHISRLLAYARLGTRDEGRS